MFDRWPVLQRALRDNRWHIIGYGVGLGAYAILVVSLFPAVSDAYADVQLPAGYEDVFGISGIDLGNPRHFISLEFFSFAPIVASIYGIAAGTGVLGAEESRGSMAMLLAQPMTRRRIFAEKVAALTLGAVLVAFAAAIGFLVIVPFVDTGSVNAGETFLAAFILLPPTLAVAGVALLLSTIAPSRGVAVGIVSAYVVAAYLAASLAQLTSFTEWLRYLSPYYYTGGETVLIDGAVWWHQLLLLAVAAASTLLAMHSFEGREIGLGRWQWRNLVRSGVAATSR
jgi:ABC-2 type transport system permease protein